MLFPKLTSPDVLFIVLVVIVPLTVNPSFTVTNELSDELIVLPVTSIVPSLCVPVPFALKFPDIVTSLGNENVTVSVAETVAVT